LLINGLSNVYAIESDGKIIIGDIKSLYKLKELKDLV
ncbi:MAG: mannose-1-phosphate guanylyltransferase, partial [Clostridiales bacterium]|nr:mannose-1-phosphate guanylyltransferase [Clostridiales bacterium]